MKNKKTNYKQIELFDFTDDCGFHYQWFDVEIFELQEAMIIQAIQEIADLRRSRTMRLEAWNWMFSGIDHPFSAKSCAKNCGLNIDYLRSLLKKLVTNI